MQKVLNADSIRSEVEDSLRRLSIEVIDVYQIHWPPDPDSAALEEGWATLAELTREGKFAGLGFLTSMSSNYAAPRPLPP